MGKPLLFAPPEGVHPKCQLCDFHFYSIRDQQSSKHTYKVDVYDDEAQEMVRSRLADAKSNMDYIRERLETHGDVLLSRWSKRSRDKRGKLLSDTAGEIFGAWPKIAAPQTSEFVEEFQKQNGLGRWRYINRLSKSRSGEGWKPGPWLKPTELAEDKMKLFALLHVRTTYSAQDWMIFDTYQNAEVWSHLEGVGPYNPRCVQICGDEFGRLVPFDPDLAHARAIVGFPRAYITILGQFALAEGLRNVVDAIVLDAAATGNSKWSEIFTDAHGLHGISEEGRWSPYVHPGLTPPPALDIDALLQASRDRFNQVTDDIEQLQTDPEYFQDYVTTLKAGINWDENVSADLKWAYVSETLMRNRVASLFHWQVIMDECQSFQAVCRAYEENYGSAIRPGCYMPAEVSDAYQRLCATLQSRQLVQMLELGCAISDMCAMKHDNKKVLVDGKLRNVVRRQEYWVLETPSECIALALRMLQKTVTNSYLYGPKQRLELLAEELSTVDSNQRTNDQLSSFTLLDAMYMSTFWGCQAVVEPAHRKARPNDMPGPVYKDPHARSIPQDCSNVGASGLSMGALREWLESVIQNYPATPGFTGRHLGPLLREFCNNPWPRGGSGPVWLEKATKSRQLLSAFWQAMRDEWSAGAEENIARDSIIANISFDVSPRYLAMVNAERNLHQRNLVTPAPTKAPSQAHVLQSTWGCETTPTDPVRRKRTKAKLVRTTLEGLAESDLPAHSGQQSEPVLQDSVSQEPTALRISVKQESLSVFNKMFSGGGTTSIRWIHLVQALTDAGMTATQVPGSGVKFSNDRESIVLHKPHPEPVVDGVMLRCQIGRKLQKWFSWDKETFVLRVKNAEEKEANAGK